MSTTRTVAIVTDSTCNLTSDVAEAHGISVVPLNVHFGESVFADQVEISTDEFMQKMETSTALPTTSQPSVGVFEEAFQKAAKEHGVTDIVCLSISSKLSGTFQSASIAGQNLADTLNVEVIDTFAAAYSLGFQALNAADLAEQGKDAKEIAETIRDEINRYHLVFFVETLEHLRRGGRIGKAAQMVGTLLQLKPLLRLDEGMIVPFERTRTRSRAIKALVAFVAEAGPVEEIAVLYNTTPDEAQKLADTLATYIPGKHPVISKLSPVIAAHIGPDVLGVAIKEQAGE